MQKHVGTLATALFLLLPSVSFADASITGMFKGAAITISTAERFAGAIYSLTWNGREFIDSADHGRELQSSASFDGLGEAYNPTEAGSSGDGAALLSTSVSQSVTASENLLTTRTRMAFWNPVNGQSLSDHLLTKRVTIGFAGMPNVIEHQVTFSVPETRATATFEAVTGYMPPEFSNFWTYDPATRTLAPLADGSEEQGLPVILATLDGSFAMGAYSPALPQYGALGYGTWRFTKQNVVKWNCVFREGGITPGDYTYTCYSIVGSLSDVTSAIDGLHAYFPPSNRPPIGWLDGVNPNGRVWGWALDPDAPSSPITVRFYLDGPAGSGTFIGEVTADSARPDVNERVGYSGDHGYVFNIPSTVPSGIHSLYVYGIDSAGGENRLLSGAPKTTSLALPDRPGARRLP